MKIFSRFITFVLFAFRPGQSRQPAKRHRYQLQPAEGPPPAPQPAPPPPNDTALFLAGMAVPKNSPLEPLTNSPAWQEHSAVFEKAFAKLNMRQLDKLHAWQAAYLPDSIKPIPVAFYMFSGPDFLYVDQFFPKASVYVFAAKNRSARRRIR